MKYVKAQEILKVKTGKYDANHAKVDGKYKFFTCAMEASYAETYAFDDEVLILPGNGANVGEVMYHTGKLEAYQRTYVLHEITEHVRYLLYYFKKDWVKQITKKQVGSATNYIKMDDILSFQIPLPPLSTQKAIAEKLDKADALRKKDKELLAQYDELAQAIFIDMFGDPVRNEKGWEIENLSDIGKIGRGKSKHRPRNAPELLGGDYPLIQTGDVANSGLYINNYNSTYSEIGLLQSKMWSKGTLCITIAANIAKTGILNFDSCFPDSLVGFVPNEKTNVVYIHYWFSFFQKILEDQAPESAQKNINLEILSNLEIICPPIKLQNEFAEKIQNIEAQKSIVNQQAQQSEELFQGLLQESFNFNQTQNEKPQTALSGA